jgi:hypothetical protein
MIDDPLVRFLVNEVRTLGINAVNPHCRNQNLVPAMGHCRPNRGKDDFPTRTNWNFRSLRDCAVPNPSMVFYGLKTNLHSFALH